MFLSMNPTCSINYYPRLKVGMSVLLFRDALSFSVTMYVPSLLFKVVH